MESSSFISVEEAIDRIGKGAMIIVVDDDDRENEGDLVFAAQHVTPQAINFMATHGRGLICLALTVAQTGKLDLSMQGLNPGGRYGTAFTQSIEARWGISTGISAADRAHTIKVAIAESTRPHDLASPGHVFPLRARDGGVLARSGHTEAAVDLSRMAGCDPSGVICEIMRDDGEMARLDDLQRFASQHELGIVTIADIIRFRLARDVHAKRVASDSMQTEHGTFNLHLFAASVTGSEDSGATIQGTGNTALEFGTAAQSKDGTAMVRIHTHCISGNVFGSTSCRCAYLLDESMRRIREHGWGAVIYLQHRIEEHADAHGDLVHRTENTQTRFIDPSFKPVPMRVGFAGRMLQDMGMNRVRLLTAVGSGTRLLQSLGVDIVEHLTL